MGSGASADAGEMRAAQELSRAGDGSGAVDTGTGKSFYFLFYHSLL